MLLQTVDWIREVALARLRGSPSLTKLDTSPHKPIWRLVNAFAYECRKLAVDFSSFAVNIIPTEAVGVWLRRHAAAYGLTALDATTWEGPATLQADGALTPAFAAGLELVFSGDGTRYQTTAAVAASDWSGGYVTVTAESVTTGTVANKASGTAVTVVSPPAGLLSTATLGTATTEATDNETDPALQQRLGNRLAGMPAAGNCAEYRQWALEAIAANYGGSSNEAVDVCVYPRWDDAGGTHGTVTVAVFGSASPPRASRSVSAACRTDIAAYIATQRPIGATVTVEDPAPVGSVSPAVQVRCQPGYGRDWYTAPAITVASNVPASRRVNVSADPRLLIYPGMRVLLTSHTGTLIEQRVVVSTGANYLILDEWTTYDPDVGSDVNPGGPLWQSIYDAILEVFEELGTSDSDDSTRPRYPDSASERPSALRLGNLYAAVENITGVASCVWVSPAADQTNDETPGDPTEIITPQPLIDIDFLD